MKFLLPLLAALSLAFLPGCSTTAPGDSPPGSSNPKPVFTPQRVERGVDSAVGLYTAIRLSRFPESRPKFEAARTALQVLVSNDRWDLSAFAQALATTGLAEQQSEQVLLIVGQGVALIDTATGSRVDLSQQEYAKAVILGGLNGLNRTLKSVPAQK